MKNKSTLFLVQAALIAAVYVVLTLVFAPFSYGEIQVRISEALTILPFFTPAAIPGLFVGCILANLLGGAILHSEVLPPSSELYLPTNFVTAANGLPRFRRLWQTQFWYHSYFATDMEPTFPSRL